MVFLHADATARPSRKLACQIELQKSVGIKRYFVIFDPANGRLAIGRRQLDGTGPQVPGISGHPQAR